MSYLRDISIKRALTLIIMGTTFVALLIAISFGYALAAARARRAFQGPRQMQLQNRVSYLVRTLIEIFKIAKAKEPSSEKEFQNRMLKMKIGVL